MNTAPRRDDDPRPALDHERFWAIVFRWLSLDLYRRKPRFEHYRATHDERQVLPAPSLEEFLTLYFVQNLPPRVLDRIDVRGARRLAKATAAAVLATRLMLRPALWLGRKVWAVKRFAARVLRPARPRIAPPTTTAAASTSAEAEHA